MTKATMIDAIRHEANESGRDVLEVVSMAQAGAAAAGDDETLEMLCDIKWGFINGR